MSITVVETQPSRTSGSVDDLDHWYCDCDPNRSLCGLDLSETPEAVFDEADCVVCEAMVDGACPRCGEVLA